MTMQANYAVSEADAEQELWLSAMFDGELDDNTATHVMNRMPRDLQAQQRWREYSLIGDAMRGCAADHSRLEKRIKDALAAEPTVLAPVAKQHRQPVYWAAAAAAVVAITWTVLSVAPVAVDEPGPLASNAPTSTLLEHSGFAEGVAQNDVAPYLSAHQDYAFAVAGDPDMNIRPVSMTEGAQ